MVCKSRPKTVTILKVNHGQLIFGPTKIVGERGKITRVNLDSRPRKNI